MRRWVREEAFLGQEAAGGAGSQHEEEPRLVDFECLHSNGTVPWSYHAIAWRGARRMAYRELSSPYHVIIREGMPVLYPFNLQNGQISCIGASSETRLHGVSSCNMLVIPQGR
jgi:hypothetical protein